MSDAAVASIVTGVLAIVTTIVGFLTVWVKLKYGVDEARKAASVAADSASKAAHKADSVENKIDHNNAMTAEIKDVTTKVGEHAAACDEERLKILSTLTNHDQRIASLETQMTSLKSSVDGISIKIDSNTKNIDSTRHELRGHMQTLVSKLDILGLAKQQPKEG